MDSAGATLKRLQLWGGGENSTGTLILVAARAVKTNGFRWHNAAGPTVLERAGSMPLSNMASTGNRILSPRWNSSTGRGRHRQASIGNCNDNAVASRVLKTEADIVNAISEQRQSQDESPRWATPTRARDRQTSLGNMREAAACSRLLTKATDDLTMQVAANPARMMKVTPSAATISAVKTASEPSPLPQLPPEPPPPEPVAPATEPATPGSSEAAGPFVRAAALTPQQIAALTPEEATAKRRELNAALLAKQEDLLSSPKREREQAMLECDAIEHQLSALQWAGRYPVQLDVLLATAPGNRLESEVEEIFASLDPDVAKQLAVQRHLETVATEAELTAILGDTVIPPGVFRAIVGWKMKR